MKKMFCACVLIAMTFAPAFGADVNSIFSQDGEGQAEDIGHPELVQGLNNFSSGKILKTSSA